jgi:YHS domain-containing protein
MMRTMTLALALCAIMLAVVILSRDQKLIAAPASASTAPATTQAAVDGPPVNKFCAVEGGKNKVDPSVFVIYKGQKIGFCCEDCIKDFNKDPDKYVASMK